MRLLRSLARSPAFTVVALVTMTLAIGASTAVFSVVDAVVLHGLPYGHADQLHTVYQRSDDNEYRVPSFPTFSDWQAAAASVHDAVDGFAFIRGDGVFIGTSTERQIGAFVTPGFFQLMETPPLLGRTFLPDEEKIGAPQVAVLSYDFFMRQFGGDRSVIGTRVTIDSLPTTIVGVMPRGFVFPNFSGGWLPPAVWQPLAVFQATHNNLTLRGLHVDSRAVLRIHAGADSARVAAAMHTIAQRIAATYPEDEAHWTAVAIRSLSDELFGQLWSTLAMISGAIALVLLLACASVANLMLIRVSARSREFALRAALGADRWRVARQPMAEAAAIAAGGGVLGLALAAALVAVIRRYAGQQLPFASHITIDLTAVLFTLAVTALTALLIGALAAHHAAKQNLVDQLRGSAASSGGTGSAEARVRNSLVSIQFALAITLLTGAGLLIQSVRRLTSVSLGYTPQGLIDFAIAPPVHRYDSPSEAAALYARIMAAVRAVPSVERVAAAGGALIETKVITSQQSATATPPMAYYHPISSDLLKTLGVRIVAGRGFTDEDMRSPTGLLVTDTLAKKLWPSGDALGQRITIYRQSQGRADFGQPITLPVIGVVADYHEFGPESPPPMQVFLPYTLEVWPWMRFIARGGTSPSMLKAVEQAVRGVEPGVTFNVGPSFRAASRTPSFDDPRMFITALLSAFAATALLLAAVGLYGVVAYAVTQRTRELGIRIAIGATRRHIVQLLLRQASTFVVIGMVAGILTALGATRILKAMLFQTATTDVTTFVAVPVVLGIVAVVASCVPAIRASRTDPSVVMRAE